MNDGDGDDYDNDDDVQEEAGPPPAIVSKPLALTLKVGEVAVFPCVVDGVESKLPAVFKFRKVLWWIFYWIVWLVYGTYFHQLT